MPKWYKKQLDQLMKKTSDKANVSAVAGHAQNHTKFNAKKINTVVNPVAQRNKNRVKTDCK